GRSALPGTAEVGLVCGGVQVGSCSQFSASISRVEGAVRSYNSSILRIFSSFLFRALLLQAAFCLSSSFAVGQSVSPTQTIMVMLFENQSSAPGPEWIGEAFP